MDNTTKKWVEAGMMLTKNSESIIACPECGEGTLQVKDVKTKQADQTERHITCNKCGASNVIVGEFIGR